MIAEKGMSWAEVKLLVDPHGNANLLGIQASHRFTAWALFSVHAGTVVDRSAL